MDNRATDKDIVKILNDAGFKTVEGRDAILRAISKVSDGKDERLCSGYGVFPDGRLCKGCRDCRKEKEND